MSRNETSAAMVLFEQLPIEYRQKLGGLRGVRKITGNVMLREKIRDAYRSAWTPIKELLRWKEKEGFCSEAINPTCEELLTERDRKDRYKSCSKCRALRTKYARGGPGIRKNARSAYGTWSLAQRAAATAERKRLTGEQ